MWLYNAFVDIYMSSMIDMGVAPAGIEVERGIPYIDFGEQLNCHIVACPASMHSNAYSG
jgi:hypothetical protein